MVKQRITEIKQQEKNPFRVNVYIDNKFAFGLYKSVASCLNVGDSLDEEKIRALQEENSIEEAYQKSLKLLSFRPRSKNEIRSRLKQYGFQTSQIEAVVDLLTSKGYLNDQQFARDWIENRSTFRPRGKRLLRLELMEKHIDEQTIQDALEDFPEDEQLIQKAVREYLPRLKGLDKKNFKKKLFGFLYRRGFSYEDINLVLEEAWKENVGQSMINIENEVIKNE